MFHFAALVHFQFLLCQINDKLTYLRRLFVSADAYTSCVTSQSALAACTDILEVSADSNMPPSCLENRS